MSDEHKETADTYHGEIAREGSHRAIICPDGIQYIIQRRKKGAGARWIAIGYCTTKKALIRLSTDLEPRLAPELVGLPQQARSFSPEMEEI